jgi:hypothetical protein
MHKLQTLFAQKKDRLRQILKSLGQSKERPNEHIDFTIDLGMFDYSTTWAGLNEAFAKNPKTLRVQVVWATDISPEACLMINDLFARHPNVETHVHTHSSLRDASLLLLLSGNRKSAAWYSWTRLTKLEELRAFENQDDEEEQDLFAEPRHVAFASNYASALKVIDSYLPVRALGSRRHNICHLLQEYGLLSEPPVLPYAPNRQSFAL